MIKKIFFLIGISTMLGCVNGINPKSSTMGNQVDRKIDFDDGWCFYLGDPENAQTILFNDSTWRKLNLPHDWSIEGSFDKDNPAGVGCGALPGGIGWYRKSFPISEEDSGKLIFIDFDGVYTNSKVWINGHYLGNRPYGYSSFRYDLTPYLHYGNKDNIIAVRVDNSEQPNSRWYTGSGIYRNVWLNKVNKIHVGHWGTVITTPSVSKEKAVIRIETNVMNDKDTNTEVKLITRIFNERGEKVAETGDKYTIKERSSHTFSKEIELEKPKLWSPGSPSLYKAVTTVEDDSLIQDVYSTRFGIRYFSFDSQKGFSLNGESLKIQGVCLHHDLGSLGTAINTRAIERQLEILKSMGANAIRTSHNPPAPELLALCDSMGFMVLEEAFDSWVKGNGSYDYHLYWKEWHKRDLEDMVKRDRNHPSVIIWSIGNEVPDQTKAIATEIAIELTSIIRSLDTTRPITAAMNNPTNPQNAIVKSEALDLIGYNYASRQWKDFFKYFPGAKFIATETTSSLATRGHYDMPSDSERIWSTSQPEMKFKNADFTCSDYDNCRVSWGASHESVLQKSIENDFVSGIFVWTGFDYLGEPTPYRWPARSSYFGIIDLAGFPKNAYYLYKSVWTDSTVLHIFPDWNEKSSIGEGWKKGDSVDVWSYYNNADEVELFLNGQSLGKRSKEGNNLHVMWRVAYHPGVLEAISYKNGKEVKRSRIETSGAPYKITLNADRNKIKADGKDLSFITVEVLDKNGIKVPNADNLIHFEIDGPGFIAGVDNGSQTDHDPFKADFRRLFNGKSLIIIQNKGEVGKVNLKAFSKNLKDTSIVINVE